MSADEVWELMRLGGVALVSGLFGALLAMKDYRFKRWWELRVAAYQNVIEALSDLVHSYERKYDAAIEYRELPVDFEKRLDEQLDLALPKVRKAADMGAFIFSDEANKALADFMTTQREDHHTYQDFLEEMQHSSKECLTKLVNLSKRDLRLKWHFFIWK